MNDPETPPNTADADVPMGPGTACPLQEMGTVVTISNQRRTPIYMYPDGGCYDPFKTVLALHRAGEWVDVFGAACEPGSCAGADGGDAGTEPTTCACPEIGLVRLEPGASLVIGPLSNEFLPPLVELPAGPDAPPPTATDGGLLTAPTLCGRQRPLAAGEYELEVDAMSGIDPYCGEACDCSSDASGACLTRAQGGDGEVLTQVHTVQLPACSVLFTFRDG